MQRLIPFLVASVGAFTISAAFLPATRAQEQPAVQLQPGAQQPPPPAPIVEAQKKVIVSWTLGAQEWDFSDVQSTYEPVKGAYDPNKGEAVWLLEIVRDLQPGEVQLHQDPDKTPFKVVLLDAERVPQPIIVAV